MNNNKRAMNQLSTMLIITIIIQIFLLIKNSLVASHFGISIELDAFNFASNLSNFVYSFIGAGISTILLPYLREKNNKLSIDIFISVIYAIGFIMLILMIMFRKNIILLLSGTDDNIFLNITSNIFIFTIVTSFIGSLIELVRGVLEYKGQFIRQKLIILFSTIIVVLLLWLGSTAVSIYYYASVILVSTVLSVFLHLFFLKKSGFKFNINYSLNDNGFREMITLFVPVILSTGVYQISLLIDTMIASRLDVGSISILTYANLVISMINMLILGNLTSYFYPRLVKKESELHRQKSLTEYILFINSFLCLIVALFFVVGEAGISILFERGNFTSENTRIVFICAILYAISLPTNGIRDLVYKYFYIKKDTLSPLINSIFISILNLTLSIILSSYIGIYGVVIGTSIASYLSLLLILIKFKRKFPIYLNKKEFIVENIKVVLITLLTILILQTIKNFISIEGVFVNIIINSVLTLIIFFALLVIVKSKISKINL